MKFSGIPGARDEKSFFTEERYEKIKENITNDG
jgi:hypothetical protein